MKPILFYDTETTGLPLWNEPSESPDQPHITQLAAELCDVDSGRVLGFMDMLIKPEGWTIPAELEELIGITNDLAERFGHPIEEAMRAFIRLWSMSDLRCGHNESFDARMVRIELFRLSPEQENEIHGAWKAAPAFCTQGNSVKIINLPPTEKMIKAGRRHAKSPNLGEAFEFFTGTKLEGAHNAAVDLAACKAVYFGIAAHRAQAAA
ncbi:3'-5' exonuclease [Paraburkholderia sp. CNPSo 3274]|uniref:3'-5' exonuclease n=1 Tax=Paraburkholderia sp. CNPSo 3274 TaxID=2940932 RepID=UPI0020B77DF2|nr:3'-5' exonuclease [Paraburkholderia sp. CNPSo 3274]MCP3709765.1 3'-5' exonuclease [Paraburkholderia sp. CNPSo 3274]